MDQWFGFSCSSKVGRDELEVGIAFHSSNRPMTLIRIGDSPDGSMRLRTDQHTPEGERGCYSSKRMFLHQP
jgi:hypothetical protein